MKNLSAPRLLNFRSHNWARRRWLDFRNGHSIYLIFLMTFANFITIQYQLLLQRVPAIHSLHINILIFSLIFVAMYVPVGMIIGYWHRKNQFSVEAEALFNQNQIGATINLFLIDLIDGKVTEEEKQHMRKYLLNIMRRAERPYGGGDKIESQLDSNSKVKIQKTE
ncbi:MAG: hypothetical protein WCC17_15455 [Candidatus Nitrosopolaris sp.]|jgi:hypothetical protein